MYLLNYHKTYFLKSCSCLLDIDIKTGIEVAFVGYSNVGKSSAINALTNQKKLARCSKTPGRTQLINFFEVVDGCRIVDLPGYGYANLPFLVKKKCQKILKYYLEKRDLMKGLVLLMDIRQPLKVFDYNIINLSINNKIPMLVLLTKCDKLTIRQQNIQFKKIYNHLNKLLDSFQIELFSSLNKTGVKQLKSKLNEWYSNCSLKEK